MLMTKIPCDTIADFLTSVLFMMDGSNHLLQFYGRETMTVDMHSSMEDQNK